ncbi:DNA-binding protein [Mesorhizobium abyssinicae]|uniref:DNA-binding protein n=1 Tax=Mesorhizobium abyssinicae TaxID=1209958 RepID=UPI003394DF6F
MSEIVARIEGGVIEMVLHWQGGGHTALKLRMNAGGKHRWTVPEYTLTLVRELARLMPDRQIARRLNRAGKPTGRGNGWAQARICSFRSHYDISVHRASEWAERGEMTLEAAAQIMDVSVMTALRMARLGIIEGRQICYAAPGHSRRRISPPIARRMPRSVR